MSFREIAITIRAVNRASHEFARIQTDAEALSVRIKSLGAAIVGLGATGASTSFQQCYDGYYGYGRLYADQLGRCRSPESLCRSLLGCHRRPERFKHQLCNFSGFNRCRHRSYHCCSCCHVAFCKSNERCNSFCSKLQRGCS